MSEITFHHVLLINYVHPLLRQTEKETDRQTDRTILVVIISLFFFVVSFWLITTLACLCNRRSTL